MQCVALWIITAWVFSMKSGIPVILDGVVRPARQNFRNFRPLASILAICLQINEWLSFIKIPDHPWNECEVMHSVLFQACNCLLLKNGAPFEITYQRPYKACWTWAYLNYDRVFPLGKWLLSQVRTQLVAPSAMAVPIVFTEYVGDLHIYKTRVEFLKQSYRNNFNIIVNLPQSTTLARTSMDTLSYHRPVAGAVLVHYSF